MPSSNGPSPRLPNGRIALYVHVPFCETKCAYCNFNTYAQLEGLIPEYFQALVAEIELWGQALDRPAVKTLFFGGGTPSWVPVEAIEAVVTACRRAFRLEEAAEVSAEANPGDVTQARVGRWVELGINRVSLGAQSLDDRLLRLLTRRHSAAKVIEAVQVLRGAGVANLNVDLIYGIPTQTIDVWRATVEQTLELRLPHLSLYALTVEPGTPLARDVEAGRLSEPDPDLAADMYLMAEEMLGQAGYRHYEISNWAMPGYECRHNLAYWRNEPFLGVGPGAHSWLLGERFWTVRSPAEYARRLQTTAKAKTESHPLDAVPVIAERHKPSADEEAAEALILNLRLDNGVHATQLAASPDHERHAAILGKFTELGLLQHRDGVYTLTSRGRLLSNEVFSRLLPEEHDELSRPPASP